METKSKYIKRNINLTPELNTKVEMYCLENNTNVSSLVRKFIESLDSGNSHREETDNEIKKLDYHPSQTFFNFEDKKENKLL